MAVVARVELRAAWPKNGKHWLMELIYVDHADEASNDGPSIYTYYDTWFEVHDPQRGECDDSCLI
jgi:hypothetical protein